MEKQENFKTFPLNNNDTHLYELILWIYTRKDGYFDMDLFEKECANKIQLLPSYKRVHDFIKYRDETSLIITNNDYM